jgi:hypothetical protein
MSLERGPPSLVKIIEELLERTVAAPIYKIEINDRGDLLRWPRDTLYPLKLELTSPTSGGRSVDIVRWRTKSRSYICEVLNINWSHHGRILLILRYFSKDMLVCITI